VQRGQRRERQGGEEREVGFHRSLDGGMTPKFKPEIRQFTTKPQSHPACHAEPVEASLPAATNAHQSSRMKQE
jgi:hypothetical protein